MNLVMCGKSQCGVRSFVKKTTLLLCGKHHIFFYFFFILLAWLIIFQYIFKAPKGFSYDTGLLLIFKISFQFNLDQKYFSKIFFIKALCARNAPNSSLSIFAYHNYWFNWNNTKYYLRTLANNDRWYCIEIKNNSNNNGKINKNSEKH